ncbi:glycosyltransferase family 2 protein [Bacillus massiliigorillae]|uniref:glycosyltransferase family 2 protein n=1 Tax=Bacillus massiliigorillae TaxID=1243664 RepID=UPI0003A4ADB7|nr:glycosyltransferase family 2 protein [Bacillus massiliigorillae]
MPILSIIIPVYNVESYLDECLQSILNQIDIDYEVILVDNAATDRSGPICDAYAARYKHINTIHLDVNSLPAGARNAGLRIATGKYVHFCDGDDYFIKGIFLRIKDLLQSSGSDVLIGRFVCIPEKGAYITNDVTLNPDVFNGSCSSSMAEYLLSLPNLLCTSWRLIVNRELLLANCITFPEGCHSEDEEWFLKVICCANTFSLMHEPFYCYRPRAIGSVTATKEYLNSKSHLIVTLHLLRFLHEKNYEDARRDLIYSRVDFLLGLFATRCDTFSRRELYELANIIEKNMDIFPLVSKLPRNYYLFELINVYGSFIGIYMYRTLVVETTLELLYGQEGKDGIYVFPTGYNGEGTARILQNAGYNVKGFLDNSEQKAGCVINGLPVSLPSTLERMSPETRDRIFVIVTIQSEHIAQLIKKQLRELGLRDSQFTSRIY